MDNQNNLRPVYLNDYKGQDSIRKALNFYIKAAKMRKEPLDHTLIYGASGLGKTSLANVIANEMGGKCISVSAPTLKKVTELGNIIEQIQENDILFIDEIHQLSIKLEETLYFAMEDYTLDKIIGSGPDAEHIKIELPKFTVIGATTQRGKLSEPLRNRFGITLELKIYSNEYISEIIKRSARILNAKIDDTAATGIAQRSRGIPRIANNFLKRVKDFAMIMNDGIINSEVVEETFDVMDINKNGLTRQDREYLKTLIKKFDFGPVGVTTLASAMNDSQKTMEETIEPYLIQEGYIVRTPRGRKATKKAYEMMIAEKEI